jgi:hypothetical protein
MTTTEQAPRGESYAGQSGALKKPSPWLASEDIPIGTEKLVTIVDVLRHRNVKFDQGRVESNLGALKFAEFDKQMVLNSTNRKLLVRLFGTDTRNWRSQVVALYVDPNVRMAGEVVNGLRLKMAPRGSRASTEPKAANPTAELKDLPAPWPEWTDEERGTNRASLGLEALQAWWATLGAGTKTLLKPKLDSEWKPAAEAVQVK